MTSSNPYETELRIAARKAADEASRERLARTADRVMRDENLDIEELLLLSVAAMAFQAPGEAESWARSVARRNRALASAVETLLQSLVARRPWKAAKAAGQQET